MILLVIVDSDLRLLEVIHKSLYGRNNGMSEQMSRFGTKETKVTSAKQKPDKCEVFIPH